MYQYIEISKNRNMSVTFMCDIDTKLCKSFTQVNVGSLVSFNGIGRGRDIQEGCRGSCWVAIYPIAMGANTLMDYFPILDDASLKLSQNCLYFLHIYFWTWNQICLQLNLWKICSERQDLYSWNSIDIYDKIVKRWLLDIQPDYSYWLCASHNVVSLWLLHVGVAVRVCWGYSGASA